MKSSKHQTCFKNPRCHCIQPMAKQTFIIVITQEQAQNAQLNNIEVLLKELLKQREEKKMAENNTKKATRKIISFFTLILSFIRWIFFLD